MPSSRMMDRISLVAQVAQPLGNLAPPFRLTGSFPLNRALAALTASSSMMVLWAWASSSASKLLTPSAQAGVDQGLTVPEVEGPFGYLQLLGQQPHLLAGDEALTNGPSELPCMALGHALPPGSSRPNSHNTGPA
jgi:hypothetical protein